MLDVQRRTAEKSLTLLRDEAGFFPLSPDARRRIAVVNAYSMLAPSVEAFVRAACGEIAFTDFSPVQVRRFAFDA